MNNDRTDTAKFAGPYGAKLYATILDQVRHHRPYRDIARELGVPWTKVTHCRTTLREGWPGMDGRRCTTDFPLTSLDLPIRIHNTLVQAGIRTPEQLAATSDDALLALRLIGPKTLATVRSACARIR